MAKKRKAVKKKTTPVKKATAVEKKATPAKKATAVRTEQDREGERNLVGN